MKLWILCVWLIGAPAFAGQLDWQQDVVRQAGIDSPQDSRAAVISQLIEVVQAKDAARFSYANAPEIRILAIERLVELYCGPLTYPSDRTRITTVFTDILSNNNTMFYVESREVKAVAIRGLSNTKDPSSVSKLIEVIQAEDAARFSYANAPKVRILALEQLTKLYGDWSTSLVDRNWIVAVFTGILSNNNTMFYVESPEVKAAAIRGLGVVGHPR